MVHSQYINMLTNLAYSISACDHLPMLVIGKVIHALLIASGFIASCSKVVVCRF